MQAGRVMLTRLHQLAEEGDDVAFETTLASRSFAPWIAKLKLRGYRFHLVFLTLPNADIAIARVAERVRMGGHDVPAGTIQRRFVSGVLNFFDLYQPMADTWRVYNTSDTTSRPIASGCGLVIESLTDKVMWNHLREIANGKS